MGGLGRTDLPILVDHNRNVSRDFGVFMDEKGHSARAVFIVDDRGILRHAEINDLSAGIFHVEDILRKVRSFQFADKNGFIREMDKQKIFSKYNGE